MKIGLYMLQQPCAGYREITSKMAMSSVSITLLLYFFSLPCNAFIMVSVVFLLDI